MPTGLESRKDEPNSEFRVPWPADGLQRNVVAARLVVARFAILRGVTPASLQAVSLAVAQERCLERVLKCVVQGLASQPGIALARVWLVGAGDICEACPMRSECPDQAQCLHLAASQGNPLHPGEDWSRLDGAFRRFPLGVRKVGRVGASGVPLLVKDVERDGAAFARPEWIRAEGIRSFGCQPLVFRGEILGALAVFNRHGCDEETFAWLRAFADHAAVALANSRAFAEIERLRLRVELENEYLREEVKAALPSGGRILGESTGIRELLKQLALVAPTGASVLILGESGTGKELVAREIHDRSLRSDRPLITVNCASIPRELFESEFFGHLRGAFTGALRDRAGRFEAADGGTLFLDEVGEIPLELQGKLLRALQEGTFERVGDDRTRHVDVRVVAATNRDLEKETKAGRFREDLFYRLGVFPLRVPPLRDRREDVPLLAAHFVERASRRLGGRLPRLGRGEAERLQGYDWPGNVRELQNVVERAVILSRGGPLRFEPLLQAASPHPPGSARGSGRPSLRTEWDLKRAAREAVVEALRESGGRIYGPGGAAERLGVPPTTLASRVKSMGLRRRG
jgi:transcriptional regulator with GAF, ATPase, and Fis domain